MIGLSKERPILYHHAKAHIFEIQQISREIWQISCEIHPKPYKIRCFNKNSSVWGVQGGAYDPGFHEILVHSPSPAFIKLNSFGWNICFYKVLGGFHEIERPLARNCNPMFWIFVVLYDSHFKHVLIIPGGQISAHRGSIAAKPITNSRVRFAVSAIEFSWKKKLTQGAVKALK